MEKRNYILTNGLSRRSIPIRFKKRVRGGGVSASRYINVPIELDQAFRAPVMATYLQNSASAFLQPRGTNGFIPFNGY
ncbi:MAG: hypothetical protein MHMPM18_002929 [Marteilia pararefringens]